MPVSHRTRDANQSPPTADLSLRLGQARVLAALMPEAENLDDPTLWPLRPHAKLAERCGYKPTSGSLTRVLNGIRPGNTTSGKPHPGLLALGFVRKLVFKDELDGLGVNEIDYEITPLGVRAYQAHVATHGEPPPVKDAAKNTNRRYRR